ncbi:hypothetical protein I203_102811 [Kwoniella mangroviensis CBS 8507]|uniref:uncharacterized protein n=1 Tax=Kwoniella mangroviensis CBS 8507 TaxID=1296122 RepID=UPI00080D32FC|nr:uncharacterized protein I203_03785 [Kwoniella mangroviensis CBS 8507]OCF67100.1 hypothetical protein I203_03785 [Kwoniella mangroviensis CBS 8507]
MSALPAQTTSNLPTEARAKRTHARRSCDVCKVRKTRCELPDLDVPSGPNPLPTDKSCHRCRVLALPCIVDDSGKKQRKRGRDETTNTDVKPTDGQQLKEGITPPKRRGTKGANKRAGTSSTPLSRRQSIVNHALDVLTGISPLAIHQQPASLDEASRIQPDLPTYDHGDCIDQSKSMKLHGRPAELACAMLKVAYGKIGVKRRPKVDEDEVNLNELLDEQTRARLQPGFTQLKTFHPHLKSFEDVYKDHNQTTDTSSSLLLATVIYLASLTLPPDASIQHVRNTLTPFIAKLRDRVILQLPKSFLALHALELLAVHAPLGVLPLELTSLKELGVARGLIGAAKNLMVTLEFDDLVENAIGPDPMFAFDCSDLWLWASLIADQATISFEDLNPVKSTNLSHARRIAENLTDHNEKLGLWQDGIAKGDLAILIGRLSVSDRLARLEEVLDTIANIKRALEISAGNQSYDPVGSILNEFQNYERKMEDIDRRHDALMRLLAEQSRGVESGWLAYRSIRRRYETNKVHVTGLRMLIATHYLSGSPHAYPEMPPIMNIASSVNYAIQRAFTPADIVRFITDTAGSKPAVEAVWDWGRRRGVNTEACLVACAELGQNLVNDLHNGVYSSIFPLHDVTLIANEAAKVLIEMEAGTIQILRSNNQIHKAFRARSWLIVMNQVSQTLRSIGLLASSDEYGGDSVANGCSNLIGSMVRSAEDWTKSLEKEIPHELLGNGNGSDQQHSENGANLPPYMLDSNGNGTQPSTIHESMRQPPPGLSTTTSHQQYMNSSDRWMASSEPPQPPSSSSSAGHLHHQLSATEERHHQLPQANYPPQPYPSNTNANANANPAQPPQSGPYPNTALDQLLSEMFCYNLPASQQGQNRVLQPVQDHHQNSWPAGSR